jgi:AcrR family transcriptional regulator
LAALYREQAVAQRLKEEVRERILASAGAVFARDGYNVSRLADIASDAGVSTSNLYRYYDGKESLLAQIVTPQIAARLLKLIRQRVRELRSLDDWSLATVGGSRPAEELLSFWIEHRSAVVILLSGAQGTGFEHVRPLVVSELTRLATQYLRTERGGASISATTQFVLAELLARTTDMIVAILRRYADRASIQRAFALFWRYQLAGLQSLLARPWPEAPSDSRSTPKTVHSRESTGRQMPRRIHRTGAASTKPTTD